MLGGWRHRIAAAAIGLWTLTCPVLSAQVSTTEQILSRDEAARRLLEAGQTAQAEAAYRALMQEAPGYIQAHRGLAAALEAGGKLNQALTLWVQSGQTLVHAGDVAEGRAFLEEALRLAPGEPAVHAALGHALMLVDEFRGAVRHLRRAESLGETSPALYLYLGASLWESGDAAGSEAAYRQALERSQRSFAALQALGGLLLWQGRYAEAVPVLEEAVRADGNAPNTRLELARALEGAGQREAAVVAYRQLLADTPEMYWAHYNLALLLRAQGDLDGAREQMHQFSEQDRSRQRLTRMRRFSEAQLRFGWALIRAGRHEEARAHFESLGQGPEALSGLAGALHADGRHAEAAAHLEQAIAQAPRRQDLRLRLAQARLAAGESR